MHYAQLRPTVFERKKRVPYCTKLFTLQECVQKRSTRRVQVQTVCKTIAH